MTTPESAPPAGVELCDRAGGRLPLTAVAIDAHVAGLDVRLEVRHVFTNHNAGPIEATYVFPLPPRMAVRSFVATFAGRVVRARIDERGAARRAYQHALAAGHAAALAEEERPSTFTMTVGNIPPGAEVRCDLECDGAVAVDGHPDGVGLAALLRVPTVVAPRYTEGEPIDGAPVGRGTAADTDLVPDASRVTPPRLAPGPGGPRPAFRCRLALEATGLPVDDLACNAPASVRDPSVSGGWSMEAASAAPDRDLVFTWRIAPTAVVTAAVVVPDPTELPGVPGNATWELTLVGAEPTTARRPGRDVVVLLDRSGSMGGWKEVAARRIATAVVDVLGAGDRFALLAFDDRIEVFRPGWTPATEESRFAAMLWCAGIGAAGGTELSAALRHAALLLAEASGAARRMLVVVTDAQVNGEDSASEIVSGALAGVPVVAIGVDSAANLGLLDRLARVSGGASEVADDPALVDEVLDRVLRRVREPAVADLRVTVPGDRGAVAPRRLPAVFDGSPTTISGRLTWDGASPVEITVSGRRGDGNAWSGTVAAIPLAGPAGGAATGRWARVRLLDMEDGWIAADGTAVDEIVALSTACSVLSRFTAFVAVDGDGEVVSGPAVAVTQPVEPIAGWAPRAALYRQAAPMLLECADTGYAELTRALRPAATTRDRVRARLRRMPPDATVVDAVVRLCGDIDRLGTDAAADDVDALVERARAMAHGDLELSELIEALERLAAHRTAALVAAAKRAARRVRLRALLAT